MTVTIEQMVARWTDPSARPPFKGQLIDNDGCCCAQGDVLRLCGWSDARLRSAEQYEADKTVASELGISLTHSVLLRQVNDRVDGCPEDVLAHPEKILGDQARRVLSFWRRLDVMSNARAARYARAAARDAARYAGWDAARYAARAAARAAARYAAGDAWEAAWATNEIQGASHLVKFFFLPLFDIADPAELDS